ncbi:zinc ABC transporter solute-binding protein [Arenibacter sp. 6A1]|uniref:metal ABC transporter solute-binding protein, Zn/Mn family n=1 Tax=Arenibacter sp. 6A1 TaxID=2720391 RepID=UPI001447810D|nr:zinc ABC transporter substrate-binding protein [Arenibacter sp. 6A1]NKI26667.1 zinc ABC transporter solute-binding protein [Arenibacter sp. 6A1]
MGKGKVIIGVLLLFGMMMGCKDSPKKDSNGKLKVVTTTSMLTDLLQQIGGDAIEIQGLMGSGVDPHLYKASEGDVNKLFTADMVFYSGLHLEGKLVEIFEKMEKQHKKTVAVTDVLDKKGLLASEYFASNYDPHIWFNIDFWKEITQYTAQKLQEADPKNAALFAENSARYLEELEVLEKEIKDIIGTLPAEKRILVTAHDAFNYFGEAYGFQVLGLQGISTATEAGVQDVQQLSEFIIENKVKSIFIETSVPRRTIEALQASVASKGHQVTIGGSLYSDALGTRGTIEGTYIGMFKYNVNTIVSALK